MESSTVTPVPPHSLSPTQNTTPQGGEATLHESSIAHDAAEQWEWITKLDEWKSAWDGSMKARVGMEEPWKALDEWVEGFHSRWEKMVKENEEHTKTWKVREEAWKVREETWKAWEEERARKMERHAEGLLWLQEEITRINARRDQNLRLLAEQKANAQPNPTLGQDGTAQDPQTNSPHTTDRR